MQRQLISRIIRQYHVKTELWRIPGLRPKFTDIQQPIDRFPRLVVRGTEDQARIATAALCERFGIDNQPFDPDPARWFWYINRRFDVCGNVARGAAGHVDYIWLPVLGRFGNNVFQMINAATFAKHVGASKIYHSFGWLPPKTKALDGVKLIRGEPPLRSRKAGLRTGFFGTNNNTVLRRMPAEPFVEAAERILMPEMRYRQPQINTKEIVVHIRGGDIMKNRTRPHPDYVQPPASFYCQAVRHAAERTGIRAINIISQDRSNPAIEPFVCWAKSEGFVVNPISNKSLEDDVEQLLAAKHLVAGKTTFPAAIAMLSGNIRSLYFFRNFYIENKLAGKVKDLFRVNDELGDYIPIRGWKNSEAQHKMIRNYPEKNLMTERVGGRL
jgi:hypothetical protein